ncbi:amelotin isoform X1 [Pleurodeles waltl]|uniref:amelotin isoform X1 n=1 Tax=Pleurodeles waltl TaxID=8319 RepID=UPI003709690B
MRTTILLLCLLGTSIAFPVREAERILSASNSGEMLQLMQLYNMLGNTPEQTQQQVHPGHGLPPAQLIPDMTAQQTQQQLSQFQPSENVFGNLPILPPLSMPPGFPQSPGNQPPGVMPYPQALPMNVGEMTVHHSMFPHPHHLFPLIITQMGQQGLLMSSEEMPFLPQVFAGVIMPPFGPILPALPVLPGVPAFAGLPGLPPLLQGAARPAAGAGISLDEQEAIPMGQAGLNPNKQRETASPAPGVTPAQDTGEVLAVTVPAGLRKGVTGTDSAGLLQTFTPPAGLRQFPTESATEVMFVEPTGLVTETSPDGVDERLPHSYRPQNQRFNSVARGDQNLAMAVPDLKPLRKHKKRRA